MPDIRTGALLLLVATVARGQTLAVGSISGRLVTVGGKAVPRVVVSYRQKPGGARIPGSPLSGMARTGPDGTFAVSGLAPGDYELCVHGQEGGWLDPCLWSATKPTHSVTSGSNTGGIEVVTAQGAKVQMRVEDPDQHLAGRENTGPGTQFVIAARTPAGFVQHPRLVSSDGTGRNYEVLVPAGASTKFSLLGSHFDVSDEDGKQWGRDAGDLAVMVAAGEAVHSVKVTVTGHH